MLHILCIIVHHSFSILEYKPCHISNLSQLFFVLLYLNHSFNLCVCLSMFQRVRQASFQSFITVICRSRWTVIMAQYWVNPSIKTCIFKYISKGERAQKSAFYHIFTYLVVLGPSRSSVLARAIQEASTIFKMGFALSNWPHFHSVYLLAMCKRMS